MEQLICKRCEHKWYKRQEKYPILCPKCKSQYWDKERKRDLIINLTEDDIIEFNKIVLKETKVKKADKHEVINYIVLKEIVTESNKINELYKKAVYLLKGIVQKHPFASGNRRTALLTIMKFFKDNNQRIIQIKNCVEQDKVLQGIRENYYTDDEIEEWLKGGVIREFKR